MVDFALFRECFLELNLASFRRNHRTEITWKKVAAADFLPKMSASGKKVPDDNGREQVGGLGTRRKKNPRPDLRSQIAEEEEVHIRFLFHTAIGASRCQRPPLLFYPLFCRGFPKH